MFNAVNRGSYIQFIYIYMDDGLSTLCHSCGFDYQQRVVKTFPGPGYLRSEDGVVKQALKELFYCIKD